MGNSTTSVRSRDRSSAASPLAGPHLHNGSAQNLRNVVRFYAKRFGLEVSKDSVSEPAGHVSRLLTHLALFVLAEALTWYAVDVRKG